MRKLFGLLVNKYTLTAGLFLVWMTFFDQNDWMTQQETKRQLQETITDIKHLSAQTEQIEEELKELKRSPQRLEQYAREHYRMKRDNEDLYVIERK